MRIDPSRDSSAADRKRVRSGQASKHSSAPAPPKPQQAASAEQSDLIRRLRALPEVRAEVVDDVVRRLRDGDLLTRQAAQQTAEAMLADFTAAIQSES